MVNYLTKVIIPFEMSAFYPFPVKTGGSYPMIFYMSLVIVLGLIVLVWKLRKNKTVVFGTLFFIINIALVSQLIPFGQALMADRFPYLAYIGLFFTGAVLLEKYFLIQNQRKKIVIITTFIAYFFFLGATTYARTKVWQSTYTLWEDVAKKFPTNEKVTEMCAGIYSRQGNFADAIIHMNRSIALNKRFSAKQYSYRSFLYYNAGKLDSAISDLNILLEREPDNCGRAKLLEHRGKINIKMKKKKDAINDLQLSQQLSHGCPNFNFGELNADIKLAEAIADNGH
jgi:tetratricopeptide (TPR) repeat protein